MSSDLSPAERAVCQQVRSICAANQLRRAARGMTQRYDTALAPCGLRVTQLPILVALGITGGAPVTAVAGALALDRTTLTRNLKVLVDRGFVTYAGDERDARVRMVALTEAGSQALSEGLALWRGVQDDVEEAFGLPRLQTLFGELNDLSTAVGE